MWIQPHFQILDDFSPSNKNPFCRLHFHNVTFFGRGHATVNHAVLVGRRVTNSFEFQAVLALLLLPNHPQLDCRVSVLVFFCPAYITILVNPFNSWMDFQDHLLQSLGPTISASNQLNTPACSFLVADKRLNKRVFPSVCPLVHRSVGPSVGWSVGPLVSTSQKVGKRAFRPLPTRPRLVLAVYPALFLQQAHDIQCGFQTLICKR